MTAYPDRLLAVLRNVGIGAGLLLLGCGVFALVVSCGVTVAGWYIARRW